ncbi:MAG: endo-1,4-beta-xylanase [Planctomycetota bacterium]
MTADCKPLLFVAVAMTSLVGGARGAGLAEAFADHFRVGVAIDSRSLTAGDAAAFALVEREFNSATAENAMKWASLNPRPAAYTWGAADRLVEFGEARGMFVVGHTLVWHRQTPDWVFRPLGVQGRGSAKIDRDELLARLRLHIQTVVGRYRGRVAAWDVVNEALEDDGSLRDTPWRRIIGDDYLVEAFRAAHDADPDAELYYNDYNLHLPAKSRAAAALVRRLRRAGCRVDGVGMQFHTSLSHPPIGQAERAIVRLADAAGKVMVTELDVNVLPWPGSTVDADTARRAVGSPEMDPYAGGLPDDVQQRLAERYAELFRLFLRHRDVIDRVTFWGIEDGRSWHNEWPIPGRTAHSLLFDRDLRPKPAYGSVVRVAAESR